LSNSQWVNMIIYDLHSDSILAATISSVIISPGLRTEIPIFGILDNGCKEMTSMHIDIKKSENLGLWRYT
jgi:hypothetical protein